METSLTLGSLWGIAVAAVLVVLIGWRAVHEEAMLIEELEGYAEYRQQVRYRFVPGVW